MTDFCLHRARYFELWSEARKRSSVRRFSADARAPSAEIRSIGDRGHHFVIAGGTRFELAASAAGKNGQQTGISGRILSDRSHKWLRTMEFAVKLSIVPRSHPTRLSPASRYRDGGFVRLIRPMNLARICTLVLGVGMAVPGSRPGRPGGAEEVHRSPPEKRPPKRRPIPPARRVPARRGWPGPEPRRARASRRACAPSRRR